MQARFYLQTTRKQLKIYQLDGLLWTRIRTKLGSANFIGPFFLVSRRQQWGYFPPFNQKPMSITMPVTKWHQAPPTWDATWLALPWLFTNVLSRGTCASPSVYQVVTTATRSSQLSGLASNQWDRGEYGWFPERRRAGNLSWGVEREVIHLCHITLVTYDTSRTGHQCKAKLHLAIPPDFITTGFPGDRATSITPKLRQFLSTWIGKIVEKRDRNWCFVLFFPGSV